MLHAIGPYEVALVFARLKQAGRKPATFASKFTADVLQKGFCDHNSNFASTRRSNQKSQDGAGGSQRNYHRSQPGLR